MNSSQYPEETYSTILNCTEGFLACSLRGVEGIISCIMSYYFIKGYMIITKDQSKIISNQDKQIYILSMIQVILLAVYYLIFQQFFLLASIRNLLIWTNVLLLAIFFKIYFKNRREVQQKFSYAIQLLRVVNFLLWFYIAVVEGTEQVNTSFILGYNCLIPHWMFLSGYLFLISIACVFTGILIYDRNRWQQQNNNKKGQLQSTQQTILVIMISTIIPSFMMFVWDYVAFMYSSVQNDCEVMFVGNNFQRKILFFILKTITMQTQPLAIYYTTFYKNMEDFNTKEQIVVSNQYKGDFLRDAAYSILNTSRNSRGSSSSQSLLSQVRRDP